MYKIHYQYIWNVRFIRKMDTVYNIYKNTVQKGTHSMKL